MRRILAAVCCLAIGSGSALAQTGGGGSSGGGGTTGGGAARSGRGAPAAAPGAMAPGPAGTPATGILPGQPAAGVANTPTDPQRNNVDSNPPTRLPPGTTANTPNGTTQPGTPSSTAAGGTPASSGRPEPGGANSSPERRRTGKNPANQAIADCMRLGQWHSHDERTVGGNLPANSGVARQSEGGSCSDRKLEKPALCKETARMTLCLQRSDSEYNSREPQESSSQTRSQA